MIVNMQALRKTYKKILDKGIRKKNGQTVREDMRIIGLNDRTPVTIDTYGYLS